MSREANIAAQEQLAENVNADKTDGAVESLPRTAWTTIRRLSTGTHRGDFQGIPATGKTIEARGMQIGPFENG